MVEDGKCRPNAAAPSRPWPVPVLPQLELRCCNCLLLRMAGGGPPPTATTTHQLLLRPLPTRRRHRRHLHWSYGDEIAYLWRFGILGELCGDWWPAARRRAGQQQAGEQALSWPAGLGRNFLPGRPVLSGYALACKRVI